MQNYNTIIGVITMRQNGCSYSVIQARYHIGSYAAQLILNRFNDSGYSLEQLKEMTPCEVEQLIYPPANIRRKDVPMPDFQYYYERIHAKDSKVNIAYCWIDYKQQNPDGYEQSQFYEYYNKFVAETYGKREVKMAVERVPGEKMYIDWVGDQPGLIVNTETGEIINVHIFATTLGVSSKIYAEAFLNEKLQSFIAGTVHAIQSYGGITKYLVPDNLKTAVKKHSRDELILQSAYSDLEDFYNTIVLPPPPRKPKGKATVEGHVRFLETHLVEKLKEKIFTSIDELNAEIIKIVAALNSRQLQNKSYSRNDTFEKYDKPCLRPLPGGYFTVCDYKPVLQVPDNYHIEYDGHYYSVLYSYCGKPAILKATPSEIRICDQYNRLICKHKRSYTSFPLYITEDSHMRPEHLYYKEVNEKDGAYYRRWASVFGPNMSELINRILKASKHEEQSYNSCAGILHSVKDVPHGIVEEAARQCLEMKSARYKTFKQILSRIQSGSGSNVDTLPAHENIRGKGFYS
ncbi:MAG: IS21 family transposase [Lachnospiraceae bacterium]|nr:IS21 family transposase [Lachnospiraceae bacterium]